MKKAFVIIPCMLLFAMFTLQGCGSSGSDTATPTAAESGVSANDTAEAVMTLDELSQYDGKNGNPAYIAVDGVIYDVTDVPQWNSGDHNGFTAGRDLTEEIKTISPHGVSKLNGLPVIGTLAE